MAEQRTISFLGPRGTFTEAALDQLPDVETLERRPVSTVQEALATVVAHEADAAMVAIENSIEGGVTAAQDALAATPGIRILSEHVVPVNFSLVAREGVALADVRTIAAHPVAYAQCSGWLHRELPGRAHLPAASNVTAAAELREGGPADAALSTPTIQAWVPGLTVLADRIGDNAEAVTRFVLVGRADRLPERTGADKTSLVVELPSDAPGALLDMLEQFATRGVNLSLIQSRPIGDRLGRYRFVLDADGHVTDERVADALLGLKRFSPKVTFLGSYPRADRTPSEAPRRYADRSFADARDWLRDLIAPHPEA